LKPSFQRPNHTYTRRSVNIKFFKKLAYLKKALTRFSVCNSVMPTNEDRENRNQDQSRAENEILSLTLTQSMGAKSLGPQRSHHG